MPGSLRELWQGNYPGCDLKVCTEGARYRSWGPVKLPGAFLEEKELTFFYFIFLFPCCWAELGPLSLNRYHNRNESYNVAVTWYCSLNTWKYTVNKSAVHHLVGKDRHVNDCKNVQSVDIWIFLGSKPKFACVQFVSLLFSSMTDASNSLQLPGAYYTHNV